MKLATFLAADRSQPLAGVVQDDRILAFGGPDGVRAGPPPPGGGGAPPPRPAPGPAPPTVYAIGLNSPRHVPEPGSRARSAPIVFVKVRGSVTGPGGPVRRPAVVEQLDYEGELAIVIGAGGGIGGYCVADDVSARDLQGREPQWTRAKGADTFCPLGPWVTTADEIDDPGDLRLRTWVNDELRQDTSTSDLTFGCEEIVAFIAQTCTLVPGDIILTGTPNGVGMALDPPRWLASGDRVTVEISGLGSIEHPIA